MTPNKAYVWLNVFLCVVGAVIALFTPDNAGVTEFIIMVGLMMAIGGVSTHLFAKKYKGYFSNTFK